VYLLRSQLHEVEHVFDRSLLTTTDTQIWEGDRVENLLIFTKDRDFYDRAPLFGSAAGLFRRCNTRLFDVQAAGWDDMKTKAIHASISFSKAASR
jgi:predicted nuclease of predicted toxin-antitoxin system